MAYYFKFTYPPGLAYSKDWHGTMPKCPKNVKVLMYDDDLGYGIATTSDTFVPPEVEVMDKKDADDEVKNKSDVDNKVYKEGTFKFDKKFDDSLGEYEAKIKDVEIHIEGEVYIPHTEKGIFCGYCDAFIEWEPEDKKPAKLKCPNGHDVDYKGILTPTDLEALYGR